MTPDGDLPRRIWTYWPDPDPEGWPISVRMCPGSRGAQEGARSSVSTGWRPCTSRVDGRSR